MLLLFFTMNFNKHKKKKKTINVPRQYRQAIPWAVRAYSVRQEGFHQDISWARLQPDRHCSLSVARNDEYWSRQIGSRSSRKETIPGKRGPWVRHRWWLPGWRLKLRGLWGASCTVYRLAQLVMASDWLVRRGLVRWTWRTVIILVLLGGKGFFFLSNFLV